MRTPDKSESLRLLKERNVPVATIIDVGVQGETPELIRIFPDRPHLLFEPVLEFADSVRRNYARIKHTLVGAAVSDVEGEVTLQVHSMIEKQKISHSGMITGPADAEDKRTVPMVTLDGYLARNPQAEPYLLKIDVDGREMQVLQGALNTLAKSSVVIIEVPKDEFTPRIAFLERQGFEIFDLAEPCYYDKGFWQCDALMIRKDVHRRHFGQLLENFVPAKYEIFRRGA